MSEAHGSPGERIDEAGARLGMWLFILSELVLFGGMFILYAAYRYKNPVEFHLASMELDVGLGAINTLLLLTSSFCVAVSVAALRGGQRRLSIVLLGITVLLGILFLGNKGFEWGVKIGHGLYPNSPVLLGRPKGEVLFFGLYYVMTGLHGLHVLVGVAVFAVMAWFISREKMTQIRFVPLENAGLYWHLVDIIWLFLFPLFYLIR
jgi:cytochrome c oxidase subunit III